jgi:AraC-like DNA-binding protein
VEDDKEKLSKQDIDFVNDLKDFILRNIEEQDLNIESLVKNFAMSRSQLNRKIKALTGMTPNNYIKTLRLKKAYELLKVKGSRVSDVAYQTGFSDPNYFTICFKKEFGENPSKISS